MGAHHIANVSKAYKLAASLYALCTGCSCVAALTYVDCAHVVPAGYSSAVLRVIQVNTIEKRLKKAEREAKLLEFDQKLTCVDEYTSSNAAATSFDLALTKIRANRISLLALTALANACFCNRIF